MIWKKISYARKNKKIVKTIARGISKIFLSNKDIALDKNGKKYRYPKSQVYTIHVVTQ